MFRALTRKRWESERREHAPISAPKCSWGVWGHSELEFDPIGDPIGNNATVSDPIRVSQSHYGEVCTHASCETARTWESFDHRGLEYPPCRILVLNTVKHSLGLNTVLKLVSLLYNNYFQEAAN